MQPLATSHTVNYGRPVLPIKRVEIFSADEWEIFIEEWLDVKMTNYLEVERMGGAGDQGRDIAAYVTDSKQPNYTWDCYQCKHYDKALSPSMVWKEFAKIIYYSFKKDYPVPRKYYFIAPKGCGTALSSIIKKADKLKEDLRSNWSAYCEDLITSKGKVVLDGDLLIYFNTFDFSIFEKIPTKIIIEEHMAHANHLIWFGGGLPARMELTPDMVPAHIQSNESVYVSQLLGAYKSESTTEYPDVGSLVDPYTNHFKRARLSFHFAEQLRNLYRDNLPAGTFEKFQEEIFDGVINTCEGTYKNGYDKVKAVETQANSIAISSNPLKDVSVQKDKVGVCHQLCNDQRLKWI
ncbi:MAG: hypothetical protein NTW29_20905 [Bacteroidetes bacterium]|nr:hypothetical protein [Bacteroidota bacterium]